MTTDAPRRRSPRRILLEVAALGVLVAVAVLWAQRGDVARDEANSGPSADVTPAAETPTPATVSIPSDPDTWKTMSHDDLEAVGRHVAEITPGFRFDRVEVFSGAGLSNAIAVLVHEKTALEFSLIPPGSFVMGSPESEEGRIAWEIPRQRVSFERAFLIARTECTQAAWDRVGGDDERTWHGATLPIDSVSWNDAMAWCQKADLRLPSEAEWEYACRAGTTTRYWSGDREADLDRAGWYGANSGGELHPAAQKPANPFGLFDVHGNVFESCEDTWPRSYASAPGDGSAWIEPASGFRVLRGGSFAITARYARSAPPVRSLPAVRVDYLGFRPAASVGTE